MKHPYASKLSVAGFACIALLSGAAARGAASYTTVHALSGDKGAPTGGVILGSDGRLYGTTARACQAGKGSVYVLIPDGGNGYIEKTLACLAPTDPGHTPIAAPVEGPDGALYGTLSEGGPDNLGAIFRITKSGELTFLHSFEGPDGGTPLGGLILGSDGLLYGTTEVGGASDLGTVFRISIAGDFESLHSFTGADGANPHATLLEVAGSDLFGTTAWGGVNDLGTIFRITKTGTLTTLRSFNIDFYHPVAPLVLVNDGNLYGTLLHGFYNGGLFRITPAGDNFEVPIYGLRTTYGLIQGSDDWLYGTMEGAAFRWHWTRSLQAFHPFTWPDTASSGLIEVGNVVFAGTADGGGPRNGGFVFRIGPYGDNDVLHAFATGPEGASPRGTLVEGDDGRFYGVTFEGGLYGHGSIFSVTRDGHLRTLHSLTQADGVGPQSGLTLGVDGALYGTSTGTVFRLDFGGAFEVQHQFEEETGGPPSGGLLAEGDGALYGSTIDGGEFGQGNLFRLDSDGTFTPLFSFGDIDLAKGTLIRASDGSLVGTSRIGGFSNYGQVFRWDELNGFLALHTFDPSGGYWPQAGVIEASTGNFFGTTSEGGLSGIGTVFHMDLDGEVTHIHHFSESDGGKPQTSLIPGGDGKLYGTTWQYGAGGVGSIYRVETGGAFEKLHDFDPSEGGTSLGPLLRASDGAFYGTASEGGLYGSGTVYRYAAPDLLSLATIVPDSGPASGDTPVVVSGVAFAAGAQVTLGGTDQPASVETPESIETSSAAAEPGSLSDLVVTNPGGGSARIASAWFADFLDVADGHPFHDAVEAIVRDGISGGCGGGLYCVSAAVTRAQMAVFLLKAEHGGAYLPPACTGVFGDVACPSPFADWIEALAAEGVTAGCGLGNYCPGDSVTRAQMAVFLLKTREGATYRPPPAVGLFNDVPLGSFAADWIEELSARGVTGGCNPPPYPLYCPASPNSRGQMAVFLTKTFSL
jgi:uncharacterized repeat protein (TIGR03803 family)